MSKRPRLFRLSAGLALTALLCDAALPVTAFGQPAAATVPPDQAQTDPPDRVGRVAAVAGTVSFRATGDTQWSAASRNDPVSSGEAVWTEPAARTVLEISASRVALAEQTELDVTRLDASGLQAVAPQGEVYLGLRDLMPSEVWSVQTPRGLVHLASAGRYGIVAGTSDEPTRITVLDGAADIEGPGVSLHVDAGQTASLSGTDRTDSRIGPAFRDAFLTAQLNAERLPTRPPAAIPSQVALMPGGEDLSEYGNWSAAPDYGPVWYPPVAAGWVPYRDGHWAYIAPWGWTWVDDASWGFTPFHYGRWLQIGGRWAWTPGQQVVNQPPVYAPALVTFIAVGAAVGGASVGWVPLGPREVYHPWYPASPGYVSQVNGAHVTNLTQITNITNTTTLVNRGAATSVPAVVMTGSQPVRQNAQTVPAATLASVQPLIGRQPLQPTAATAGVTPALARHWNLAPAAAGLGHTAPGPAIHMLGSAAAGASPPLPQSPQPVLVTHGAAPGATHPLPPQHEPNRPVALAPADTRPVTPPERDYRSPGEHRPDAVAPPANRAAVAEHPTAETRPVAPVPQVREPTPPRIPAPVAPRVSPPPHPEAARQPPSRPMEQEAAHDKRPGQP